MEFDIGLIQGVSIGFELPPAFDDEVEWNFILDLLIIRIVGSKMY